MRERNTYITLSIDVEGSTLMIGDREFAVSKELTIWHRIPIGPVYFEKRPLEMGEMVVFMDGDYDKGELTLDTFINMLEVAQANYDEASDIEWYAHDRSDLLADAKYIREHLEGELWITFTYY